MHISVLNFRSVTPNVFKKKSDEQISAGNWYPSPSHISCRHLVRHTHVLSHRPRRPRQHCVEEVARCSATSVFLMNLMTEVTSPHDRYLGRTLSPRSLILWKNTVLPSNTPVFFFKLEIVQCLAVEIKRPQLTFCCCKGP